MGKPRNLLRRVVGGVAIAVGVSLALLALDNVRAFAAVGIGCTFGLVFTLVTDGR